MTVPQQIGLAVFLFGLYCVVSNFDYADKLEQDAIQKVVRVQRAAESCQPVVIVDRGYARSR